jgi:hypothetical protein
MCLLCVEIQKDRMKLKEVVSAYKEMVVEKDHLKELDRVINDKYGQENFEEALSWDSSNFIKINLLKR